MASTKPFLENPRTAFGLLAGYFLLHLLLRPCITDSLQTDEAEQLLVTQAWLWGYGSQPPLYDWLQIMTFRVLGVNVFALALLKDILLFCVYLFTYLAGREIFQEKRHALLATLSLLLIPVFTWESHRDRTHLVLATAIATATMYVALRLFKSRGIGAYCLLGTLAGLGIQAKYNYAVVPVALLLAAISLPAYRPAVLDRKMFLAAACFLLVVAPHGYWALSNPRMVLSQSDRFYIPTSGELLAASLRGAFQLAKVTLEFTCVPVLVFGLLSLRSPVSFPVTTNQLPVSLIRRTILVGLVLCLITVFAFHVTMVRVRWLQPLLIGLPLVAVAWAQPRLDLKRMKIVFALAVIVMVAVPAAMYGSVILAGRVWRTSNFNIPYRAFAGQIRAAGFTNGVILAEHPLIAGNLRLYFPESTLLAVGNIHLPIPADAPVLLVWRSGAESKVPQTLMDFAVQECGLDPNTLRAQEISAPALYAPKEVKSLWIALAPALTPPVK